MFLEDGEDLVKQLLFMQVVELQGGVHLVDDGMLVHKSRKLLHDGRDKITVILGIDMNVITWHNHTPVVHAHV